MFIVGALGLDSGCGCVIVVTVRRSSIIAKRAAVMIAVLPKERKESLSLFVIPFTFGRRCGSLEVVHWSLWRMNDELSFVSPFVG